MAIVNANSRSAALDSSRAHELSRGRTRGIYICRPCAYRVDIGAALKRNEEDDEEKGELLPIMQIAE